MANRVSDHERHSEYLQAMGIQVWHQREPNESKQPEGLPHVAPAQPVEAPAQAGDDDWQTLVDEVAACTRCELSTTRTQTVFGVGDRSADWLIIGEAPGADEDRQGEPFVGRAGKLLNAMLFAAGLRREQVYIANILKCRPPGNRDPKAQEVVHCEAYLRRQVALIQPKIILAVGRIAAQNLLKSDARIGALRGQRFEYADTGIPVVATYHPAYLLRSPLEKRKSWSDLQLAMRILSQAGGGLET
ncbi:MAG: uracil-DNA glycosylase [Gammaproteobacteria bacterium]|nr:uracil-DNA glycosylase [Gammaproteobacteria bacterium]